MAVRPKTTAKPRVAKAKTTAKRSKAVKPLAATVISSQPTTAKAPARRSTRTSPAVSKRKSSSRSKVVEITPDVYRRYVVAHFYGDMLVNQSIFINNDDPVAIGTMDGRNGGIVVGHVVRKYNPVAEVMRLSQQFAEQTGSFVSPQIGSEEPEEDKSAKNRLPDDVRIISMFCTEDEVRAWLATK
jgi:hypothetical protein